MTKPMFITTEEKALMGLKSASQNLENTALSGSKSASQNFTFAPVVAGPGAPLTTGKKVAAALLALVLVPVGLVGVVGGFLLCLTIIGALVGIPMMLGGFAIMAFPFALLAEPKAHAKRQHKVAFENAMIKLANK